MTIVADAGPLMAFAKIGGLETLFSVFPKILTTPAVYEETVTAGLQLGAQDAGLLESAYGNQQLEVRAPQTRSLPVAADLGKGEVESILLAIEEVDLALALFRHLWQPPSFPSQPAASMTKACRSLERTVVVDQVEAALAAAPSHQLEFHAPDGDPAIAAVELRLRHAAC